MPLALGCTLASDRGALGRGRVRPRGQTGLPRSSAS